ncbi:Phenylacetic acid catabolic protein [Pseudonocardia nigra]|uniref:Phenylacetic acid catabolic protein n=1 Tax=Pseudonocardia nigra TaxID=1921578 RepID=UPI001C604705|nr:Phenylacetic acid catabolic protein [Pseudonocardia nigra]
MVNEENVDGRLDRKFEAWSEMTGEYRAGVRTLTEYQVVQELVGLLPYADWLDRAPDVGRKQMLIAKIQDEVGHGHIVARVAEDLGGDRDQILTDFVEGKAKLVNAFHYRFETWEEFGPAALLGNSTALVQFQSLKHGTYLPYARALKKIEREESFHYHHALDLTHEMMTSGNEQQRTLVQEAFEKWFPRMLAVFGPDDSEKIRNNPLYQMGLKVASNHELRQRWVAKMVPVFQSLGVRVDPALASYDSDTDRWNYAMPDWKEVANLVRNGGPAYHLWVEKIRRSLARNSVYRDVALSQAA